MAGSAVMGGSARYDPLTPDGIDKSLRSFLANQGIHKPVFTRVKAGRNSRVWRVDALQGHSGPWILKEYYRHPGDQRDRLGTEYGFVAFLSENGFTDIPRPVARQNDKGWGLFSFLPGEQVRQVTDDHIHQAAEFICRINALKHLPEANTLPRASEACFSLHAHVQLVHKRLAALSKIAGPEREYSQAQEFITGKLLPSFEKMKKVILSRTEYRNLQEELPVEVRILSPSDFGFHNTLSYGDHLFFLDFEYAGWDDPAKLFCDFACQPQVPLSLEQAKALWKQVEYGLNFNQAEERALSLLPLHRMKWCCILLNEFRTIDRKRRLYADDDQDGNLLLQRQLHASQTYFQRHIGANFNGIY